MWSKQKKIFVHNGCWLQSWHFSHHMRTSRQCDFEVMINELQVGLFIPEGTYGSLEWNTHCGVLCLSTCCVLRLSVDVGQPDVLAGCQDRWGGRGQLSWTLLSVYQWRRLRSVTKDFLHTMAHSQFILFMCPYLHVYIYECAQMGKCDAVFVNCSFNKLCGNLRISNFKSSNFWMDVCVFTCVFKSRTCLERNFFGPH